MNDITGQILANTGSLEETKPEVEETPEEVVELSAQDNTDEAPELLAEQEETSAQKSWKELRGQAEEGKRTKKELAEAYRMLKMMEHNMKLQQQQNPYSNVAAAPVEEEFNIDSLDDEEYSSNKQIKKIFKQQQREYKKLREDMKNNQKQAYVSSVESRIRHELPDFKEVVSESNVERLREERPSIFKSLSYNPDTYEQAVGAYEAIKEFGIYSPNKYKREEYQLEKNLGKPKSAASIGTQKKKSALDDVSRFNNPSSDDLKSFYEDAVRKSGRSMSYNS